MCTRYVLKEQHLRDVLTRLGIAAPVRFSSRYNIAPNTDIPVVRAAPRTTKLEGVTLRWGLVPSWAKTDDGPPLVNARADTVATKPSFRDALRTRRCLIPATGFYEWETVGRAKKPWLFRTPDEQPFCFAGLWDAWQAPDGTVRETCAFITGEPNDLMRPIHHRMPVMLSAADFGPWLDPAVTQSEQLTPLLRVPSPDAVTKFAVSTYVSNVRHEGPACLAPAGADDPGSGPGPQLSLGF
ncbi:MAG: SOS response-associated peptidase [Verrucomicrobia bacterium]|nr:SOS response-associated peptidase [Verrucomicrobiota bacterium]